MSWRGVFGMAAIEKKNNKKKNNGLKQHGRKHAVNASFRAIGIWNSLYPSTDRFKRPMGAIQRYERFGFWSNDHESRV
jgi:hypothetical protein